MKVCIICKNINKDNINRLPKRIIYEISKGLLSYGNDVVIISTINGGGICEEILNGIKIRRLKKLSNLYSNVSSELIDEIKYHSPDIILWLLGTTTFLRPIHNMCVGVPNIGIFTSPLYNIKDIVNAGLWEMYRSIRYLWTHILGLMTPKMLIKNGLNGNVFNKVVVVSHDVKKNLIHIGVKEQNIRIIRIGISNEDFYIESSPSMNDIKHSFISNEDFLITYFGSPLTLRGIDTLIKAFSIVNKKHPKTKLLLLTRIDHPHENAYVSMLRKMCNRLLINNSVYFYDKFLHRNILKSIIASSKLIILPFKIVISDTPLVILETLALGKLLITTPVDGITELIYPDRGILVAPNNPHELATSMENVYLNFNAYVPLMRNARIFMNELYPKWSDVYCDYNQLIQDACINRGKLD